MFLKNWWYVAAWPQEVTRVPMRRVFMNEPVTMYRLESGAAVAIEDRCAHRNFPLSKGCLIADHLRCGYHGLTYGPNGIPVHAPGQVGVPTGAAVLAYPPVRKMWAPAHSRETRWADTSRVRCEPSCRKPTSRRTTSLVARGPQRSADRRPTRNSSMPPR